MKSLNTDKLAVVLENAGVKPTANRIIVLKTLAQSASPLSLIELETVLETLDRSSILRVLVLLSDHGLVHVMEDGRGVSKYEICHSDGDHHVHDDHHVHFYCEKCMKVYCLEDVMVPHIPVPSGFDVKGVNFMLKGVCAYCNSKTR